MGPLAKRIILFVLCAVLASGCTRETTQETLETEEATPQRKEVAATASSPDTTAEALWTHLQAQNYQETWQLWPGKTRLYKGIEPHGMLLTTHVNPLALDALTSNAGKFSPGAIIVKENYKPDSTLAATTVMYKVEGYDSEHNDWFWLKRLADGTVEVQGRGQMCQSCHGARADNDYIMTASIR